ncbi:hypothetical protein ACHAQA_003765 [Verticillium albo-atrum]
MGTGTDQNQNLDRFDTLGDDDFTWGEGDSTVDANTGQPTGSTDFSPEDALSWALRPLRPSPAFNSHDALVKLSQINIDLHSQAALVDARPADSDFCVLLENSGGQTTGGMTSVEFALVAAQNFLRVLTRLRTERPSSGAQRAAQTEPPAHSATLQTLSAEESSSGASFCPAPLDALAPTRPPEPVPKMSVSQPLALAITSVYIQIAAFFELILRHLSLRLQTLRDDPLEAVGGLSFGALALTDVYMQGIVFTQIVGQLLQRIDWTLGVEGHGADGLLSRGQRDMLWEQMGVGSFVMTNTAVKFELPSGAQYFTPFAAFPVEIRHQIWEAAIFEPGMHFLKIVPNNDQGRILAQVVQGSRRFLLVKAHLAPVFPNPKADTSHYVLLGNILDDLSNTCTEADRVVQRLLRDKATLKVNGRPITLTSHTQDIVCLEYLPPDIFYSGCRISHDFHCPGLDSIRHVAVRYCHKWETPTLMCDACGSTHIRETTRNHPVHVYQFIARHCPQLETFYFIDYLILRKESDVPQQGQCIPGTRPPGEKLSFKSSGRTFFEVTRDQDDWLVQSRVFETLDWVRTSFRRYAVKSTTTRHRHTRPGNVQFRVLSCEWDVAQATAAPKVKSVTPRKGVNKRAYTGEATERARKTAKSTRGPATAWLALWRLRALSAGSGAEAFNRESTMAQVRRRRLQSPTASTLNGTYAGRYLREFDQDVFRGIRYAKAPRLQNPQPLTDAWVGVRPAKSFGNLCPTTLFPGAIEANNFTINEDCLNLNIVRPAGTSAGDNLPVVVWIHGGSFSAGSGADATTNTSYIIKASVENELPIIAITINYRLGFYGFPGGSEAAAAGITNLGLKDQYQALRWIQENIDGFGGDPAKVTLWGQSAGAMSITYQILAYGGRGASGLFRGAIAVSGTAGSLGTNSLKPDSAHLDLGYNYILNATNCLDAKVGLDCLRKVEPYSLYQIAQAATTAVGGLAPFWWPSVDGDFVAEPPTWQLQAGRFPRDINVITGANNDEGLLSVQAIIPWVDTEEQLSAIFGGVFTAARPETLQKVLAAYPSDAPSPPYSLPLKGADGQDPFCAAMRAANLVCGGQYRRAAAIFGDLQAIAGRRLLARSLAKRGVEAYSYRFDTNPTAIPISNILTPGFATHSSEYAYFFNLPVEFDLGIYNPPVVNVSSHLRLARGIVDKFATYIATGDPNAFKVKFIPEWPVYSLAAPKNLVLNATESNNKINVRVEADTWRSKGIALWEEYAIELDLGSTWRPEV